MRRFCSALLANALCLVTCVAAATDRRVGILQGDAELLRSLSLSLSAWDVETVPLDGALPEASQPEAVLQAKTLSARFQVDALVWISPSKNGALLWIYDARTGGITTRVLDTAPPLDSAAAAGVALSVKTTLRDSAPAPALPPPVVPRAPEPESRVTLRGAVQWQAVAADSVQPALALASTVWLGASRRFGLGLRLTGGSGVLIQSAAFSGRYRDQSFGPVAELRLLHSPRIAASLFAGGALHAASLSGSLLRDGAPADVVRYDPGVTAGGALALRLTRSFSIGVEAQVSGLLGYQRYLVDGEPVLSPYRVSPAVGGHLGLNLF